MNGTTGQWDPWAGLTWGPREETWYRQALLQVVLAGLDPKCTRRFLWAFSLPGPETLEIVEVLAEQRPRFAFWRGSEWLSGDDYGDWLPGGPGHWEFDVGVVRSHLPAAITEAQRRLAERLRVAELAAEAAKYPDAGAWLDALYAGEIGADGPRERAAGALLEGEARRRHAETRKRIRRHWPRPCARCRKTFRPLEDGRERVCTKCRRLLDRARERELQETDRPESLAVDREQVLPAE